MQIHSSAQDLCALRFSLTARSRNLTAKDLTYYSSFFPATCCTINNHYYILRNEIARVTLMVECLLVSPRRSLGTSDPKLARIESFRIRVDISALSRFAWIQL